ncbi:hypothetical protein FJM67_04830 [Maribrevibacterium harenarium]|uniref:Polysaccharide chain length determinant N-terminal domain-containing protein n=1 Tax=Maribrevibacterium harenarium TaxID=2589817 RepID=A0A501X1I2_9GAMM|nr:Wzz/FepE/Etk N-terminal domain-containing protein [Maribrevibacterium harenarium]TPE54276.1 hypothetical protein FJM67_04830 [Maribrevibacterium harenarium]
MEPISQRDDEIDLFELFESIWEGKWKIALITAITSLVGLGYVLIAPPSLSGNMNIGEGRAEVFYQYVSLNQQLAENDAELIFDAKNVFNEFVSEFRDYDEIINAVASHSSQYQNFAGSEQEQRELLIQLAKQFELAEPGKNDSQWQIRFKWYDEAEAKLILADALNAIVGNVKKSIVSRTEQFAKGLEASNSPSRKNA